MTELVIPCLKEKVKNQIRKSNFSRKRKQLRNYNKFTFRGFATK